MNIGQNIQAEVEGDKLTLVIDLSVGGTRSRSGKSEMIATTRGNVQIAAGEEQVIVGVNVYRPVK